MHTHTHKHIHQCFCSTDIDPHSHMTYLWPTWQWHVSYWLMWQGRTVRYICHSRYKQDWTANKCEGSDYNYNRRFLTAISLLSHIILGTTVCRQQTAATHQDSSVHWWQNCQYNVCQPIQTSVPCFLCHILQQIFLWWCRPTGTVNCTWHIRQWNFSSAWYHRIWNSSL